MQQIGAIMNNSKRLAVILGIALFLLAATSGVLAAVLLRHDDTTAISEPTVAPETASADSGPAGPRGPAGPVGPAGPAGPAGRQKTPVKTPPRTPPPSLPDGKHLAIIVGIDVPARKIRVDKVQILYGAEAVAAQKEDHVPEVIPDYYIRNQNKALRTLAVVPGAQITVNVHGAEETGNATEDISKTLAELADIPRLQDGVFWLTLDGGVVVRISEMYLP